VLARRALRGGARRIKLGELLLHAAGSSPGPGERLCHTPLLSRSHELWLSAKQRSSVSSSSACSSGAARSTDPARARDRHPHAVVTGADGAGRRNWLVRVSPPNVWAPSTPSGDETRDRSPVNPAPGGARNGQQPTVSQRPRERHVSRPDDGTSERSLRSSARQPRKTRSDFDPCADPCAGKIRHRKNWRDGVDWPFSLQNRVKFV